MQAPRTRDYSGLENPLLDQSDRLSPRSNVWPSGGKCVSPAQMFGEIDPPGKGCGLIRIHQTSRHVKARHSAAIATISGAVSSARAFSIRSATLGKHFPHCGLCPQERKTSATCRVFSVMTAVIVRSLMALHRQTYMGGARSANASYHRSQLRMIVNYKMRRSPPLRIMRTQLQWSCDHRPLTRFQ